MEVIKMYIVGKNRETWTRLFYMEDESYMITKISKTGSSYIEPINKENAEMLIVKTRTLSRGEEYNGL